MSGPGVYATYVQRSHEPEVVAALQGIVQPGWVCLDIGAHYGYFTLLLAQLTGPTGRVIAFEAIEENAAILRRNVALNNLEQRVTVENYAISDGSTNTVHLALPETFSLEWTMMQDKGVKTREAPAIALDDYFKGRAGINLVKMDIEGAEALAIRGMHRVLKEARPVLVIELHGEGGQRALQELWQLGYHLWDLERQIDYKPPSGPPLPSDDAFRPQHVIARSE
jgi:FkbM family methyltransferase